ncbi:MAG TPA: glutathione S-transferase N-terminal domain-containing protein [Rhizomicrobium sp.]|jgi:GST-like protein|nr:glutathione S-transferase N-terminal domain-containing protein [Rhizomicrobium sp.]
MLKAKAAVTGRAKRASRAAAAKPNKKNKSKQSTRLSSRSPAKSKKARPIALYYWPTPNGWKITIMLEECGLPYEIVPVNIGKGEQFEPDFLKIAPNNRMPAIVDPDGPGGRAISVFESGAILQYLGRKTGKFYPADERKRVAVEEWLFWQMAGLGPMAGQANHFRTYAKDNEYGVKRYTDEVHRLLGVMNRQLSRKKFLAGDYSIADMACIGWVIAVARIDNILDEFPNVKTWMEKMRSRPAVSRGLAIGRELREQQANDPKAQELARKILFGQRART